MSPQHTVKGTGPPAGGEGREVPACHGHGGQDPAGDEGRAHIWTMAREGVAEAQGTSVSEVMRGHAQPGCHMSVPHQAADQES